MHVRDIQITRPDSKQHRVRLQSRVSYDRHAREEIYWLEVPESMAHHLSLTGSPWLMAMLPIAATFGERLRIDAPVDPVLLQGAQNILSTWSSWDMGLHNVDLELETHSTDLHAASASYTKDGMSGVFFSAGVDSFFTVLQLLEAGEPPDELIFIAGFDRHLHDTKALQQLTRVITQAADELRLPAHTVATNLRQTLWGDTSWSFVAHGCATAFIALALEPRYREMYLAASVDSVEYDTDMPWGSHPDVDPLFSSSRMKFIHHGDEIGRFDKVRKIAGHRVVQKHLSVCYQSEDGRNCGRCKKCLIASAMLDMLGVYKQATCFDHDLAYIDLLRRLRVGDPGDIGQLSELRDAAASADRAILAKAADDVVRRALRPWNRAHYLAERRLMLWAPHIRDRLRRSHLKAFASDE
jgi:hypothetical protein